MAYLAPFDFWKQIQRQNLSEITGGYDSVLTAATLAAQEEVSGALAQKYLLSAEFTDTLPYNPTVPYNAGQRVYLDASPYSAYIPYPALSLVLQSGHIYINLVSVAPESFNPAHWVQLGVQYALFYVGAPYPAFSWTAYYNKGDQVFYKNNVYTCIIPTTQLPHGTLIQYYEQTQDTPANPVNTFPDTPIYGLQYWGVGVPFSVPAGTLYSSPSGNYAPVYTATTQAQYTAESDNIVTAVVSELIGQEIIQIIKDIQPLLFSQYTFDNTIGTVTLLGTSLATGESLFILYSGMVITPVTTSWVQGDNRCLKMVEVVIDIALYHIHSRISPKVVPELRMKRYIGPESERGMSRGQIVYPLHCALGYLQAAARGNVTPNLIPIQPAQGRTIRWASQPKLQNSY